ncbi:EAL and HDOD domain-containing protein [Lacimicrobium alkaliphilum]|uniref:Diguanylate phosphodiesterase n=1 Tax=Lacimicrobium alkaliphilum TaxID=1526571 RepID=A0A0U3BES2_9ALTE|nr:EAL domain-containing protein [Lacimicrobium alkaliphilum]ALT00134.1 diguanylate phosphodiesterase [Lacimicrobium alkaliphilum]
MFAYVARHPILDTDKNVYAYELLFRDGRKNCFPDIKPDEATSKIITASHLTLGLEDIACHKTSFINFHKETLINGFPTMLDPESVVVEIVDTVPSDSSLVGACKQIKDMGYKLALDDHNFDPRWDAFLPYVDIIKVDTLRSDFDTIARNLPKFQQAKVKLVAEKVETYEDFNCYRDMGFDYFQGFFFSKPEVIRQRNLPTSKLALLELLQESSSTEFSFERVNAIFERDVGLSYMLLRFINNPTINKRYKISSLRHALNYLGELELKKFISILALANMGEDKPIELLHLSLVRAKFCELVSIAKKDKDNPPKGFLVGLFSLLDALLDQDMSALVGKLPIDDEIRSALCGGEGRLRNYLGLAKAFESANWLALIKLSGQLELSQKMLHGLFNEAIVWGNGIRQSISPHFPRTKVTN